MNTNENASKIEVDGVRYFATFGEAFRAAMAEQASSTSFAEDYPCDACGRRARNHELVRTPGGGGSVHPRCLPRWAELVS